MKYVSLDLETTGLDASSCGMLSLAMVVEDSNNPRPLKDLPSLLLLTAPIILERNRFVPGVSLEPVALAMNAHLLLSAVKATMPNVLQTWNIPEQTIDRAQKIAKDYTFIPNAEALRGAIVAFLKTNGCFNKKGKVTLAGKNVAGFDAPILRRHLADEELWTKTFDHRFLDPGSMFVDWGKDDAIPGLMTCEKRALGSSPAVVHDAYEDALQVVRILRTTYDDNSED